MDQIPRFEVVAPVEDRVDEAVNLNRRPKDLTNKTVGFVWDYLFNGPVFFAAIQRAIDARFANVHFVDYEGFGNISTIDPGQLAEELPRQLRAAGVDVAVVAVGA
jgi:hypothetical protein